MQPRHHRPSDRSTRLRLVDELSEMFDRATAGYLWAVEHEQWSAAFEYRELIDQIRDLSEQAAA
jgi:hypothetical protein